jgi:hypothetical protein
MTGKGELPISVTTLAHMTSVQLRSGGLSELIRSKVCDDGTLVQILCFWTLSIVLSLSNNAVLFISQNITFRRLDSVSVSVRFEDGDNSVSETLFCLRPF